MAYPDSKRLTEWINPNLEAYEGVSFQPNTIYCGDCQEVLPRFPEQSIDLIYADPPFFTDRKYEVIWGDGYELRSFEDRWKGGIQNYIAWMEPKLRECHRLLKDTGSMYLHCDWHAAAYLRVEMDRIFGYNRFTNEIIWQRTKSHNDPKQYGRIHDTILFYTKTADYTWNPFYLDYDPEYIETAFRYADKDGRRYQTQPLHASKPGGDTSYAWKGQYPPPGRFWAFSKANMEKLDGEGRIIYSRTGVPRYKIYADEGKGRPLQDLWTDIPGIHQTGGGERLGYPTQKPEALLERMISVSSHPTEIVLDPFCGCGTAIAVAHKTGRRWIGIDVSPTACKLMAGRMRSIRARTGEVVGMPRTEKALRALQPFEFQNWVFEKLHGRVNPRKTGDMGIDGWVELDVPCQVKQSDDIGRNVVDNFETAIQRAGKDRGVIVAFSFGRGAHEEVARVKNELQIDIKLKTVEEILNES